jgi:CysZ protein
MSPVFSQLSERTDQLLNNTDFPFSFRQFVKDILRGIMIAFRSLFIELGLVIVVFIFSFIPVLGLLAPFILFLISSYFYGFSFLDYTNERKRRTVSESLKYIWRFKWISITIGALFSLIFMIPFAGSYIAVFFAIFSTVAGTLAMNDIEKLLNNQINSIS